LTKQTFYEYEKKLIGVSEIHAIIKKSRDHFAENAIRPLVEFYPLNKKESKGGSSYELLNVTKNSDTRENKLKTELEERNGIYLFYNSQGQVIYVGKARDQGLWNEMKSAFNRERTDQEVYKVNHPTTGSDFDLTYLKPRQIVRQSVKLHDIAAYFSAYQVEAALIDHMEAAIIRMIPNDCLNVKIEKIHINKI